MTLSSLHIRFLGTGTSHGVPRILCDCPTCVSTDARNQRLRTSVFIQTGSQYLLIDTSIDFRQQCLTYRIPRIDAVLYTHHHVDHIFGLDDLRVFNVLQKSKIPCYGSPETMKNIRHIFSYIFDYPEIPGGIPLIDMIDVEKEFRIGATAILPIPIFHGRQSIYAYRIGGFVYATDCSGIPDASAEMMANADILVLDCLRRKPHPTHFHLEAAIAAAQKIGARKTFFTHMSHDIEHAEISSLLPEGIYLAYDGLELTCT